MESDTLWRFYSKTNMEISRYYGENTVFPVLPAEHFTVHMLQNGRYQASNSCKIFPFLVLNSLDLHMTTK